MKRLFTAATVAFALTPLAAGATTIPRVDFGPGETHMSIGIVDVALDRTLSDEWSIGAVASMLPPHAGLRMTRHLETAADGAAKGWTFSAGYGGFGNLFGGSGQPYWAQAAYVWETPFWNHFVFRGSMGPTIFTTPTVARIGDGRVLEAQLLTTVWLFWPSYELAWRISRGLELTYGGNSLLALRGRF